MLRTKKMEKAVFRRCSGMLAVVATGLLITGCAVGPDYDASRIDDMPGQNAFSNSDSELFSVQSPMGEWWRLYETPALDAAVQEALEANTDLRVAAANLNRAEAIFRESRAGHLPSTQINASEAYSRQFFFFDEPIEVSNRVISADLSIAYQFDLFGRVRRMVEAAVANAEAMEAAYHATQITVAAETTRAWAEACAAGYQLDVARRSINLQGRSFELVSQLRDAGRGTALDVASASSALAQTRAMLPTLRAQHQAALYRLATLMGREPSDYPQDVASCSTPLSLEQAIPVGDGAGLLRRRPDIRQAERELATATARVGVAVADFYPTVSFGASLGSTALSGADLFTGQTETLSLGPSLSWVFPNIIGTLARKAQAEADVEAAVARFDGVWLNALRETETALSNYRNELERVQALEEAREYSADAARLANARFEAGQLNFLDVVQAELVLSNAEMALAESRTRIASQQVALFLALGGGWSDR